MSVAQENFETAVAEAAGTLTLLDSCPRLEHESLETLHAWMWDLEAVVSAIRSEVAHRGNQPIDLG